MTWVVFQLVQTSTATNPSWVYVNSYESYPDFGTQGTYKVLDLDDPSQGDSVTVSLQQQSLAGMNEVTSAVRNQLGLKLIDQQRLKQLQALMLELVTNDSTPIPTT